MAKYLLQLKILLWKNYTLKKRRPYVLMFELFIPLVLFFILLAIRRHQPAKPRNAVRFSAQPLPSAGVLSIMQAFCDGGIKTEQGFYDYPEAKTRELLVQLDQIVHRNKFFETGLSPEEMNHIPVLYRSIIDDPVVLHNTLKNAKDFDLTSVLGNSTALRNELQSNLSLSQEQTDAVLNAKINTMQLYRIFFGEESIDSKFTGDPDKDKLVLQGVLLAYILRHPSLLMNPVVKELMLYLTGFHSGPIRASPTQIALTLKHILLTDQSLKSMFCLDRPQRLLEGQNKKDQQRIDEAFVHMCAMNKTMWTQLSGTLDRSININKSMSSLNMTGQNISDTEVRFRRFLINMKEFVMFERNLKELSHFAQKLPQNACLDSLNSTNNSDAYPNPTKSTMNDNVKRENEQPKKTSKYLGLLKLWIAMQTTLCGQKYSEEKIEKLTDSPDLDELGLSKKQRYDLGILLHVLYSNPKVLYAPNSTQVNDVIGKANATFALMDQFSEYARSWLNVSAEIQDFLKKNSTSENLLSISEMRDNIREMKLIEEVLSMQSPLVKEFLASNYSVPTVQFYIEQLQVVDNAACSWISLVQNISLNVFQGFSSEEEIVDYILSHGAYRDNVTIFASVIFTNVNEDGSLPPHVVYKIRQNASFTHNTRLIRPPYWYPGPIRWGYNYYQFGFIWIQDIIERALIDFKTGKSVVEPGSYVQQFPYPCYLEDMFLFMIEHVMPLCLTVSWVYTVAMLVQNIVHEKEQRLKEVMKMMGMNNSVHWLAWFITTFIQMTISMLILTMMLHFGNVLHYSDPLLVFLLLEIFTFATISFSFLISAFYSKAKVAAACAGIIYFLTYVPYMYVAIREEAAGDKIPFWAKTLASLFSTTAFGLGAKYLAYYEIEGVGVQWDNIRQSPVEDDLYNLLMVMIMMVIDSFIYITATWYTENVHPGSYGLPKPWYFPFTCIYWFGCAKFDPTCCCAAAKDLSVTEEEQACAMHPRTDGNFEQEPTHLPLGVQIENLRKIYKSGKVAVNRLNINLFEDQITSFLGHNGAGKTTTMSILTGLFPPTSGYATIYGHDIRTDMEEIRRSLGMCPQHNVLFNQLTVEEHLWFYAKLKGLPTDEIASETNRMIDDLQLPAKRHSTIDCLSGGMKRKLSVAIAFVGGSRTVILDEPTAGVDPYARRAIWDLLIKFKKGRTILLSTHHMDEADILGDRIAIISNGQVMCCGSPLFLKTHFGEGYHLTLVKKKAGGMERGHSTSGTIHAQNEEEEPFVTTCSCQESKVTQFILKYVSSAFLKTQTPLELHYILPFEELHKGGFSKLFKVLDENLANLGISSYGIADTQLEEVFLKVTERTLTTSADDDDAKLLKIDERNQNVAKDTDSLLLSDLADEGFLSQMHDSNSAIKNLLLSPSGGSCEILSGYTLLFQQFCAVLYKRFIYVRRNWKSLFSQILLPAVFVCVAMTVALSAPQVHDMPPVALSPSQYFNSTQPRGNYIPYSNVDAKGKLPPQMTKDIIATFRLPSGVGSTCILRSAFNSSFDAAVLRQLNRTFESYKLLAQYFAPGCESVFVRELPLENFVPRPPTLVSISRQSSTPFPITPAHRSQYYQPCVCSNDSYGFICPKIPRLPPILQIVTSDIMLDITGDNEEDYYLYTTDNFRLHRYGAFSFGNQRDYVPDSFGLGAPSMFQKLAVKNIAKVWYNHKGYHAMPTYLNSLNNAILRANIDKRIQGNPAAYGITVINHPMNNTNRLITLDYIMQGSDVLIAIFIIVAMSFVPASFVLFLVYERSVKAKHLQLVSGINRIIYWGTNYLWDICNYLIPAFCCIIILRAFNIPAYVNSTNFPAVVSLFLLYGWSITPMMYPASFLFNEPSSAYVFLIVINLFIGITCIITSFLLEIFQINDQKMASVHEVLKNIFLIFPNYCLGRGLMDIAFNEYQNEYYLKTGDYDKMQSPFLWVLMGRNLVAMTIMGASFFMLTLLCEYKFFIKPHRIPLCSLQQPQCEDPDVAAEKERVETGRGNDMLVIDNLTKIYKTRKLGSHLAVDRLTLGIPQGECFGMLGVNGAGKTTTFRMLTGDLPVTGGDAVLNGDSVTNDILKVQQKIGYCPQFDALFDELTAREHLYLYSMLRGIPLSEQKWVVDWALTKLLLSVYADRPSGTYSAGNKRKLATAIALIGHPPIIFLDEPTTGMDPHSRRFLWDLILSLVAEGRSVVLTSHSMEECQALCSRLAIMVNGRFQCLGSVQHLKSRFGDGYTLTVRVKGPNLQRNVQMVKNFIERHFPTIKMKECHHNLVQWELASVDVCLSNMFEKLEEAQRELSVEDYSISQNTLDNVFINFVKNQVEILHVPIVVECNANRSSNSSASEALQSETELSILDTSCSSFDDQFLLNDVNPTFEIESSRLELVL